MRVARPYPPLALAAAVGMVLSTAAPAHAEPDETSTAELRKQIVELSGRIAELKQTVAAEEATLTKIRRVLGIDELAEQRGTGPAPGTTANSPPQATQAMQSAQIPVGQAPTEERRPAPVAALFDQPGVLTPRGHYVLEPSLQYTYASSNRIALVGYTIIPALVIGLIDVREVKRNTLTAALTGRWGISNRFEMEAKVPLVYRSDSTLERPLATGAGQDNLFNASGRNLGDIELTGRYQLNEGGNDRAYYVSTLRFKTHTGKDPFEVITATSVPGGGLNTQLQRQLPTGSGFYTLQPGLTALYASDPAVFFGSISYQYNFARSNLSLQTDNGPQYVGEVKPGGVIGFNFGMGLALNDRASFSLGYDHAAIGKTNINGDNATNSMTTQLGTLLLGFSYRLSDKTTINLSLGVGATRDAPDVQLALRIPFSL